MLLIYAFIKRFYIKYLAIVGNKFAIHLHVSLRYTFKSFHEMQKKEKRANSENRLLLAMHLLLAKCVSTQFYAKQFEIQTNFLAKTKKKEGKTRTTSTICISPTSFCQ